MPRQLDEWQQRIKAVEREFKSTRLAMDRLLADHERDVNIRRECISLRDLHQASDHLDGTYVIRLFAEFEMASRLFWESRRRTKPAAEQLLNSIAALRKIPNDQVQDVHDVREYRNNLVHGSDEYFVPIAVADVRHALCHFLSFLPPTW